MSVHQLVTRLPEIARVREISQAIAMLDAILCPDWTSRFFSYDVEWGPGEALASMRNGAGDEYSIVFSDAGCCARGFDHESPLSPYRAQPVALWPGLVESVPAALRPVVAEPAFTEADGTLLATVVLWREAQAPAWACGDVRLPGPEADGADELFAVLADGRPQAYLEFAEEYYGRDLDLRPVQHCYHLRPLTRSVVTALNPDLEPADLEPDRRQIGYPAPVEEVGPETPRQSWWRWPLL